MHRRGYGLRTDATWCPTWWFCYHANSALGTRYLVPGTTSYRYILLCRELKIEQVGHRYQVPVLYSSVNKLRNTCIPDMEVLKEYQCCSNHYRYQVVTTASVQLAYHQSRIPPYVVYPQHQPSSGCMFKQHNGISYLVVWYNTSGILLRCIHAYPYFSLPYVDLPN